MGWQPFEGRQGGGQNFGSMKHTFPLELCQILIVSDV